MDCDTQPGRLTGVIGPVRISGSVSPNVSIRVPRCGARYTRGGLLSGSGALLSEAAHSVGDTSTQLLLLLTAVHRSTRPADRKHPFGYGKERYFWSLLAAMGILVSGAASIAIGCCSRWSC